MTVIELPGEDSCAFDHLAGYGLAAVLDVLESGAVRLAWTDALEPRLTLSGADWAAAGDAVCAHAAAHTSSDSWVQADGTNVGVRRGLFSPRVKPMEHAEARTWYARRNEVLDGIGGPWAALDHAMIGALGEPSYWSFDRQEPRPDYGASRWEMKTRNRGEEFVANRLRLLAWRVGARTPDEIASGIAGTTCVDEVGRDAPDSRTPTGLMPPQATDNARAWCALWGLSLLPAIHARTGASRTAGHIGHHSQGHFYVPLMTEPLPVARLRSVLWSAQLRAAATAGLEPPPALGRSVSEGDRVAAWTWLEARGVPAVVRFPVFRSPNVSAPEKWAQRGVRVTAGDV